MARKRTPPTGSMESLACPPRFATPRNPDRPTLGGQVGEIARRLGTPFMPWQQYVADVSYEYDPDTGLLFYDETNEAVPRQSGKTTGVKAETVHRLVVMPRFVVAGTPLGPQRSTYLAQNRGKARLKLERDFAVSLRQSRSFREILNPRARPAKPAEWRLSLNNGAEAIEFGGGCYWQIDVPSRDGGHGDTLDDATIDEAFAHEDDEVEGGIGPTQATRHCRRLRVKSTAGDARSKYWYRKILAGRRACETGRHGRTAFFEWSAPDDADPADPAVWAACSPALGLTIPLEFLQSQWEKAVRKGQAGIDTFRRAYLNQWPEVPVLDDEGAGWAVIAELAWGLCGEPGHRPQKRQLRYALDVDENAKGEIWATLGCSDYVHVEAQAPPGAGPGTAWVVPACAVKRPEIGELVLDPKGRAGALIDPLEKAGIKVRPVTGDEFAQASMQFADAVADRAVRHLEQPTLTAAVAGAERRHVGDGAWKWSRTRSVPDIGPLNAVTLARWAAGQKGAGEPDVLTF